MTTPSQVYDLCATDMNWLAGLLRKAIACLEEGDHIGGGIKLQRVVQFMDEKEWCWQGLAYDLEKEESE